MTKEQELAILILQNEYRCVDRDCDIECSCGKCDLAMPSKEPILKAYKIAIQAIKDLDTYREPYKKGYEDGVKATQVSASLTFDDALDKMKAKIKRDISAIDTDSNPNAIYTIHKVLQIIDKCIEGGEI